MFIGLNLPIALILRKLKLYGMVTFKTTCKIQLNYKHLSNLVNTLYKNAQSFDSFCDEL